MSNSQTENAASRASPPARLPYLLRRWGTPALVLGAVVLAGWLDPGWAMLLGVVAALTILESQRSLFKSLEAAWEQQKTLDEQLIQSQKLASLGEMAAGIAHEINTPLAVIGQESELMQLLVCGPDQNLEKIREELLDSIQQIEIQVERCGDITHKLLGFARKNKAVIQEIDVNGLAEDMVLLVEHEARFEDIEFRRSYSRDVSSITTDPALLRQVVLNLLNNAVQAVGRDGMVEVWTRMKNRGWVEIGVRDTGCGIPQENLDKIFLPFFTTKPPGKGTGLGLPICMTIMQKLGGSITVESEVGKGTTFRVRLPLKMATPEG